MLIKDFLGIGFVQQFFRFAAIGFANNGYVWNRFCD